MENEQSKEEFNKYYWAFVYLISTYPKSYLSKKGKIIFKMVIEGGKCRSIAQIARYLGIDKPTASRICKEIQGKGDLSLNVEGNRKSVGFSDDSIKEGLKIAYGIIK
tara:strand:+ start:5299 stop:5619 length:321 start_codon:yes stop_codon:yes gene_type:complete